MRLFIPVFILLLSATATHAQLPVFTPKSSEIGFETVSSKTIQYGNGTSAADYDQDGDIDIYVCTNAGISDHLYVNNGDGSFTEFGQEIGLGNTAANRASLWFDYNGDHLLDLIVFGESCVNLSCTQPIICTLYQQLPNGQFEAVPGNAGITFGNKYDNLSLFAFGGLAAGDINQDGFLDLLVTIWGGPPSLFLNQGNGTFKDISILAGFSAQNQFYWQPMFHDFNGDGRIDIYCNIDFDENELWINRGNNYFQDVAREALASYAFNEMGMALGDYDNDGDLDIYATNITKDDGGRKLHNILLRNDTEDGKLDFRDRAPALNVANSGWDWGTTFADFNNDGRVDLATTNGWDSFWHPDSSRLWINIGGAFTDISEHCGFNDKLNAATLLALDFDRDGDVDLLQTLKSQSESNMPALLYENSLAPNSGDFVVIKPRMEGTNHFAIGALVKLTTSTGRQVRLISAGTSFYGQEPAEAHFGISPQTTILEVQVQWPDGTTNVFTDNLNRNSIITLGNYNLPAPEKLSASAGVNSTILSWIDRTDDEDGFVLQISDNQEFTSFTEVALPPNTEFYVYEHYKGGSEYYRVRAFKNNSSSGYSNTLSRQDIITALEPITKPVTQVRELASSNYELVFNNTWEGEVRISVFDLSGKQLYQLKDSKQNYGYKKNIRINDSVQGVLLFHIVTGNESQTIKYLKGISD